MLATKMTILKIKLLYCNMARNALRRDDTKTITDMEVGRSRRAL